MMKRSNFTMPQYDVSETRTLLITNISEEDQPQLKEALAELGDIRETYTIAGRNILFVIFYDVRAAMQAKASMNNKQIGQSTIKINYTVSKYEIPKENDICDETKNQGTLLLVSRDLQTPLTEKEIVAILGSYGEIKEIREYKAFQKFVEFYDTRCAVKAYNDFGERAYKNGTLMLRYLWDMSKKKRWEFVKETDDILEGLIESTPNNDSGEEVSKIRKIAVVPKDKHYIVKAFDDFIADNIDTISEMIEKNR
ncbi:hypothetical protein EDEG_03369 [Edhazardia aedis USNM 41457]|uniref:RRM domain-containing protein n=1 Tax=Edhazardia aedis (strain USNM 41457) TaxID=1003232 RepID=J8ZR74_EDHAE|nr:hypothetical protein EDEG_03369 [Edhazardia aedis USNM 41457]|eukprot:EJW02193.1 hypothetical protein EDEG_03369 [Edhazardia aedis USNM 41457]